MYIYKFNVVQQQYELDFKFHSIATVNLFSQYP